MLFCVSIIIYWVLLLLNTLIKLKLRILIAGSVLQAGVWGLTFIRHVVIIIWILYFFFLIKIVLRLIVLKIIATCAATTRMH